MMVDAFVSKLLDGLAAEADPLQCTMSTVHCLMDGREHIADKGPVLHFSHGRRIHVSSHEFMQSFILRSM